MRDKYIAGILLFTTVFLISSSASSQADPNTYAPMVASSDSSSLLAPNSGIVIDALTVEIQNNVYTFTNFDPQFTTTNSCIDSNPNDLNNPFGSCNPFDSSGQIQSLIPNPENYVLSSPGVLVQAGGNDPNTSAAATALTALINDLDNASQFAFLPRVTNLSSLQFSFSTQPGADSVTLDFILASGEHYKGDWDLAGIFIDGENFATLPNGRLLRVNESAEITNVCNFGFGGGCELSNYDVNSVILGTISPKLTLFAPLNSNLSSHTFMAAVANTDDIALSSSLLISNFQAFGASQEISAFAFGIQLEEEFTVALEEVILQELNSNSDSGPVVIQISIPEPLQISIPDPLQKSKITSSSITAADSNNDYVKITLKGEFPEAVRNIDVNGRRVSVDSWQQDSSTITVTVPAVGSGSYVVNVWNGSAPVLPSEIVIATSK